MDLYRFQPKSLRSQKLYSAVNIKSSIIFFSLFLYIGCKDNPVIYTVGEGDGEINGYVNLIDTNGNLITTSDFSDVVISVEGGPQFTRSDGDGQFTLANIPRQKITLIFDKSGFAQSRHKDYEYKGLQYQYFGIKKIVQISRMTPNIVLRPFESPVDTTKPYEKAVFSSRVIDSISNSKFAGRIKLYFGKSSDITPRDPNSFQYATPFSGVNFLTRTASFEIYNDTLIKYGFSKLTKVYVCAFYCGLNNDMYIHSSGKAIYTGLSPNHSEVKSFILP